MSMLDAEARLLMARQRADHARLAFTGSLEDAKARIAPARLKQDVSDAISGKVQQTKQKVRDTVDAHPVIATTAAAGTAAVIFWRPARLLIAYGLRATRMIWLNRFLWKFRK